MSNDLAKSVSSTAAQVAALIADKQPVQPIWNVAQVWLIGSARQERQTGEGESRRRLTTVTQKTHMARV